VSSYTALLYTKLRFSIFIVHGLNGGTAKTFAHPKTGSIWFLDFLPKEVVDPDLRTNARIWIYGYDADLAFQNAGNRTAFTYANDMLELVHNVQNLVREQIHIAYRSKLTNPAS
jgi:hypothetical protein